MMGILFVIICNSEIAGYMENGIWKMKENPLRNGKFHSMIINNEYA